MNCLEYIYRTLRYEFGGRQDQIANLTYLIERDNRALSKMQEEYSETIRYETDYEWLHKKQQNRIKQLKWLARKKKYGRR